MTKTPITKTPIRWYGGKKRLLPILLELIPPHKCYVEVFGGSGALLFSKKPSPVEVYNDINKDIVHFFKVLRNPEQAKKLKELCELTPYARDEYVECKTTYEKTTDPIERARQFFVLTKQSFNSMFAVGWTASATRNDAIGFRNSIKTFTDVAKRLETVNIDNKDFLEIIDTYERPETLFYLDPPYLHDTRVSKNRYKHEMTTAQHESLLKRIADSPAKIILSGYESDLYDQYLKGWKCIKKELTCNASPLTKKHGKDNKRPKRTEIIWINRTPQIKTSKINDMFA